jgi:hypothetical protein
LAERAETHWFTLCSIISFFDLIPITRGVGDGILGILLISPHTSLLDDRANALNSSGLHIRIRYVFLALREEIPISKIRDPGIIGSDSSSIIETPECNLCSTPSAWSHYHIGLSVTYLFQSTQVLSIVCQIRIINPSLQPRNTSRYLRASTTELHHRRLTEHRVRRRRRHECQSEEILDAVLEAGEVA